MLEEISETTTEEVTINISQMEDDEINTDDIPDDILVLLNDGQMYENLNGYEKNGLNMYLGVRKILCHNFVIEAMTLDIQYL